LGALGLGASLRKRNHPIIEYYVPLHLNINNPAHISEIEEVNGLQKDDLLKVQWVKPLAHRSTEQTCSHLILSFSNPDTANRAKVSGLIICNKRVSTSKYKKEPIRCLKCQGWNHLVSECIKKSDTCGTCGTDGHRTSECNNKDKHHCISCNTDDHSSWARNCPTFVRKCREFNLKHPENGLPFYPSQESWTWASEPPRAERWEHAGRLEQIPIRQKTSSQHLRQQQLRFEKISALSAEGPQARPISQTGEALSTCIAEQQTFPDSQLSSTLSYTSPPVTPLCANETFSFSSWI